MAAIEDEFQQSTSILHNDMLKKRLIKDEIETSNPSIINISEDPTVGKESEISQDEISMSIEPYGSNSDPVPSALPDMESLSLIPNPANNLDNFSLFLDGYYLTANKLKTLTGSLDLSTVTFLEMKLNLTEVSISNIGILLPNLTMLKLSNSTISSIRDLGSSLAKLKVLWLSQCSLDDIDGLGSFPNLEELYLAHNNVSELSPCSMLEKLKILDLEGNLVYDLNELEFLSICTKLLSLSLEGNPICKASYPGQENENYNYKDEVKRILPNIQYLDDERLESNSSMPPTLDSIDKEYQLVNAAIKNDHCCKDVKKSAIKHLRYFSDRPRPKTSSFYIHPLLYWSERHCWKHFSTDNLDSSNSSKLTNTVNHLVCGKASRSLIHRKAKNSHRPLMEIMPKFQAEQTLDFTHSRKDSFTKEEIFTELRNWKKEHECYVKVCTQDNSSNNMKDYYTLPPTRSPRSHSSMSDSSIFSLHPSTNFSQQCSHSLQLDYFEHDCSSSPFCKATIYSCSERLQEKSCTFAHHNKSNKLPNIQSSRKSLTSCPLRSPLSGKSSPDRILESSLSITPSPPLPTENMTYGNIRSRHYKILPSIESSPSPALSSNEESNDNRQNKAALVNNEVNVSINNQDNDSLDVYDGTIKNDKISNNVSSDILNYRFILATSQSKPSFPLQKRPITSKAVLQHPIESEIIL